MVNQGKAVDERRLPTWREMRIHPQATPEILRRLLADMVLGPELAERVYGPLLVLSQETIETE